VLIRVARAAFSVEPEKCFLQVDLGLVFLEVFLDELRFVTRAAIERAVLALEIVAAFGVAKTLDPVGPVDEVEIRSRVLAVALETRFLADGDRAMVITAAVIERKSDLLVARETLLHAGPRAHFVALRAVRHPLEERVTLRELAGGNLGVRVRRDE